MISIIFKTENDLIKSFEVSGHSFYADSGKDIVCAAVTSAIRYFECAINDVLGADVPFSVDEKGAEIISVIPEHKDTESDRITQIMLKALLVYFTDLVEEYPENIQIREI